MFPNFEEKTKKIQFLWKSQCNCLNRIPTNIKFWVHFILYFQYPLMFHNYKRSDQNYCQKFEAFETFFQNLDVYTKNTIFIPFYYRDTNTLQDKKSILYFNTKNFYCQSKNTSLYPILTDGKTEHQKFVFSFFLLLTIRNLTIITSKTYSLSYYIG